MSKKTGKKAAPLVKGKLEITRSGMGYVIVEGRDKDLLVRPQDFNKAMDGDIVRVKIKDTHGKRVEGIIEEVVERKQTEFIGNIHVSENFAFVQYLLRKFEGKSILNDYFFHCKIAGVFCL